jgi:hypothetical protein
MCWFRLIRRRRHSRSRCQWFAKTHTHTHTHTLCCILRHMITTCLEPLQPSWNPISKSKQQWTTQQWILMEATATHKVQIEIFNSNPFREIQKYNIYASANIKTNIHTPYICGCNHTHNTQTHTHTHTHRERERETQGCACDCAHMRCYICVTVFVNESNLLLVLLLLLLPLQLIVMTVFAPARKWGSLQGTTARSRQAYTHKTPRE